MRRVAGILAVLGLAACGGATVTPATETGTAPTASEAQAEALPRGGTLRVGLVKWAGEEQEVDSGTPLDPMVGYTQSAFELFRCCLVRTLMAYNGAPGAEGGAVIRPDLAAETPEVSPDGLTWTFRLEPGLRYAPPFDDQEIVAADVVRAVERAVRGAPYSFYYVPLIEGSEAFAEGNAETITGLETPDEYTLIVHLTEAAGDLGERFALPAAAPSPPGAADSELAASGPYLLERYTTGESITLARNPSWDPASDDLREAYPDRIELTIGLDEDEAYRRVEAGELDLVLDVPAPLELASRYHDDPALEDRLLVFPVDIMWYAAMNVASPPFDDVHVRRAVNLVADKDRVVELWGGPLAARPATHVAPDALVGGSLLVDYDPYATPGQRGDVEAARAEMAKSRYDDDGDGRCDDPSCGEVTTLALANDLPVRIATPLADDLEQLGITLAVEELPAEILFPRLETREHPVSFATNLGWAKDFPNGSGWFPPLFDGSSPGSSNPFLVGLSAEELARLGYATTSIPNVDEEIAECIALVGGEQTQCWADLDQLLMEQVVPAVPLLIQVETRTLSERVASATIDQLTNQPALDRIALKDGGA